MKTKKKMLSISILLASSTSFALSYNVIVDQEKNEYDIIEKEDPIISEWYDINSMYDCVKQYEETDFLLGEEFTQTEDCSQDQERTITTKQTFNGEDKTTIAKETKTIDVEHSYQDFGEGFADSCKSILDNGYSIGSGTYQIQLSSGLTNVVCDMDTDGGGWTVFQNRTSNTDFYKGWADYKKGFGAGSNFWLGNDIINEMTTGDKELRINFKHHNGSNFYAHYTTFSLNNEANKYKLKVSGWSGNNGDSLSGHNNANFTTKDNDNDSYAEGNCSVSYTGAWWYTKCHSSNLNGLYLNGNHSSYANGINWYHGHGHYYSYKETKMMFR